MKLFPPNCRQVRYEDKDSINNFEGWELEMKLKHSFAFGLECLGQRDDTCNQNLVKTGDQKQVIRMAMTTHGSLHPSPQDVLADLIHRFSPFLQQEGDL